LTEVTASIHPGDFDLRSLRPEFYANPFPIYARLRQEAPVLRCPDGSIFLTRHADLLAVYRDNRRFSSDKRVQFGPVFGAGSPLFEHHTTSLVFNDPPLHTRVRRAIGDALSPRVVGAMELAVETLVGGLLDRLVAGEVVDLVTDYAAAIPVEVICNLLAIPPDERSPLRDWSLRILGSLEVSADAKTLAAGQQAVQQFLAYLAELVETRRSHLVGDDIVARLLRASASEHDEAAARTLSLQELLHQCIFLLNAGHETTTNLIANGIVLLCANQSAQARLRADPAAIDTIVEEVLRMESPNQLGNRTATADVSIDGVQIHAGTIITLCIGAANRDPAAFIDPDTFQWDRTPNPHLAFGGGIHTCAGLSIARLEGRVGLLRLFQRFPDIRIVQAARAARARFRGFERLEVLLA
jgi:cytochrome P450